MSPDRDRCSGRLRLIALIQHGEVIRRILTHLGLPTERAGDPCPLPPPLNLLFADN